MPRQRLAAIGVGVFVLFILLAGAGYDRYVLVRHPDRARLTALIVSDPPRGYDRKPAASNAVSPGSHPFSSYSRLAKSRPGSTGAWTVSWSRGGAPNDSATILVSYLPSPADARTVQAQAAARFTGPQSFRAESYTLVGPVAVPGVPEAQAAVYRAAGSATTPPVAAVVFPAGRAQVLELMGKSGTPASTGAAAAALARAEADHLRSALGRFTLTVTIVPAVATVTYWLVVAALAVSAAGLPLYIRRRRRLRVQSQAYSARRGQQVRGSKVARRQAKRR